MDLCKLLTLYSNFPHLNFCSYKLNLEFKLLQIHIIAHILSLLFMWISLGPVVPKLFEYKATVLRCRSLYNGTYPDTRDGKLQYAGSVRDCINEKHAVSSWHGIPALIAFIFQHFLVAFGFWRATHTKLRLIQVALHSHFGYGCWLLGGKPLKRGRFFKKLIGQMANDN